MCEVVFVVCKISGPSNLSVDTAYSRPRIGITALNAFPWKSEHVGLAFLSI